MSVTLSDRDLSNLILSSFESAQAKYDAGDSKQKKHSNRSRNWVEALAHNFREHFEAGADKPESDMRVFSKYYDGNQADFGLNEFLFDIFVCKVGTVISAKQNRILYYIRESIWEVESELKPDSKQALIDFNKLLVGTAPNKLFVGPLMSKDSVDRYLDVLRVAATVSRGTMYIALVPHPSEWEHSYSKDILVTKFDKEEWVQLDDS